MSFRLRTRKKAIRKKGLLFLFCLLHVFKRFLFRILVDNTPAVKKEKIGNGQAYGLPQRFPVFSVGSRVHLCPEFVLVDYPDPLRKFPVYHERRMGCIDKLVFHGQVFQHGCQILLPRWMKMSPRFIKQEQVFVQLSFLGSGDEVDVE